MTREEEILNAGLKEYGGLAIKHFAFEKGAQWADEHPRNPWRDANKELPEGAKSVIGIDEDGVVCGYEYSPEEGLWSIGMLISDAPQFWMPIPEIPKGGER